MVTLLGPTPATDQGCHCHFSPRYYEYCTSKHGSQFMTPRMVCHVTNRNLTPGSERECKPTADAICARYADVSCRRNATL
jgi:hypothetical protein